MDGLGRYNIIIIVIIIILLSLSLLLINNEILYIISHRLKNIFNIINIKYYMVYI